MIRAFPFSVKITVVRSFVATFLDDVNGAILVTGSRVECAKSYNSTRPLAVTRANNVAMDGDQEMSLTGEHNSSFTSFCFSEKLQSLTVESAELVKKIVSSTGDILILVTGPVCPCIRDRCCSVYDLEHLYNDPSSLPTMYARESPPLRKSIQSPIAILGSLLSELSILLRFRVMRGWNSTLRYP